MNRNSRWTIHFQSKVHVDSLLFFLYISNILSVCRESHRKFEVSAGYTKLTECGQLSYKGYLFTCSS